MPNPFIICKGDNLKIIIFAVFDLSWNFQNQILEQINEDKKQITNILHTNSYIESKLVNYNIKLFIKDIYISFEANLMLYSYL